MGFTDTMGNFFSNLIGKVEKATIVVVDDGDDSAADGISLQGADSKVDMAFKAKRDLRQSSMEMLGELQGTADGFLQNGKQFKVQFNPATLQFNASGGGYSEIKDYAKSGEDAKKTGSDIGIKYGKVPFQVTMEVDLIFNKVDSNDAFVEVFQGMSTFKGLYKTGANLTGKNSSYSVQNEIEGLIAATRVFTTCLISFNWGKMHYCGILQNLNTNYTVFNPKGEPVAGTAHLSMILIDEGVNQKSAGKWVKAYKEAFDKSKSLASTGQSVGGSAFSNFTF